MLPLQPASNKVMQCILESSLSWPAGSGAWLSNGCLTHCSKPENNYCLLLLPLYGIIHLLGAVWCVSAWAQQKPTGAIRPPQLVQTSEGCHTSLVHHCDLQEGTALVFREHGLFPLLTSSFCNAGSVMFIPLSTLLSKWQSSGCFLLAARTCHHGWAIL